MRDQEIEQPRQLGCGRLKRERLLRRGQQLQSAFALRHQAFEQGRVQPVQILERVEHSERGPNVEMQCAVPQRRKIHQQHSAVSVPAAKSLCLPQPWWLRLRPWRSSR